MALTVKHNKVSSIPDAGDTNLVQPSDWNADHTLTGTVPVSNGGTGASTLTGYVKGNGTSAMTAATTIPSTDITGLGTIASQDSNNVTITGGSISGATVSGYIPTTEKAQPLGVATLDADGKVPTSQIPMQGDLNYQGSWNASTNTPTLTSSVGTKGYYYVVSVAGATNLDGITDWQIGDWAIFNGSIWQKVDNTDAVTSVNGFTGTVVLTTTNIAEGTNEYFTQARARASISAGTAISYDNSTGVITNTAPDQTVSLTAGSNITITGTYPSFTIAASGAGAEAANTVYAAPNGSSGTPSFRSLVANDIPDLLLTKIPEAWVKMSCKAATTANITLSGAQTIDGVALVAGNRCLVKNQTAAQDNGIYDVSAGTWTRSTDANAITEIAGATVAIDAGTVNGGKIYANNFKTTDTLGVTAMNWAALVNTNGATFDGAVTLRAGTGTAGTAPLYMTSGTVLTTAAAGALEYDGNTPYFSIAGSTRGVMCSEQIVVLTGTNTLTSQTAVQPIFDGGGGPTNGSVTLPIGTYQFECVFALTGMSAASGSFGFALGGAATKTYTYQSTSSKAGTSLTTPMAPTQIFSSAASTALQTASTGTVGAAMIKGIIRVTVAGTVIPQISLTVASAGVVQAGSYFKVSPLGNVSTVATVGNWT